MIICKHNGLQISCQKACWKGYDGANVSKWKFEIEPFVAQWVVQMEKDMHEMGAIENHKLL
jgi:hypothetical protein